MSSNLVEVLDAFPALPESCMRLEELLEDPGSTTAQVANLVGQDAPLTANILKLANSAFYAVAGGVDSLPRAINTLGFSAIHQMVLCLQTQRVLNSMPNPVPSDMLEHATAVGALCRHASEQADINVGPSAYIAGLLHDMGRMALAVLVPEKMARFRAALERGATPTLELEVEHFGVDHQTVGRGLADKWRYPKHLVAAVCDHHGPGRPTKDRLEEQCLALGDLVAVADHWAWQLDRPGIAGGGVPPLDSKRIERTDLEGTLKAGEKDELRKTAAAGDALF